MPSLRVSSNSPNRGVYSNRPRLLEIEQFQTAINKIMLQQNSVRALERNYKDRLGPSTSDNAEHNASSSTSTAQTGDADYFRNSIFEPTVERYGLPIMYMSQLLLPRTGLDFLYSIPSLSVEQTFELHEYAGSSENRFIIRNDQKEAIYTAAESSTARDRMLFGASRSFTMHILDRRHKDILKLERKYAFSALCCNGQCIDVWIPPGDLIGRIREQFSLFRTVFVIENDVGDILYRFNGFPRYMWNSFLPSETEFTILGVDDKQQTVHGTIRRCWQTDTCIYTQIIDFTNRDMNIKHKALFIAASILLEYVYYQSKHLF